VNIKEGTKSGIGGGIKNDHWGKNVKDQEKTEILAKEEGQLKGKVDRRNGRCGDVQEQRHSAPTKDKQKRGELEKSKGGARPKLSCRKECSFSGRGNTHEKSKPKEK